MTDLTGKVALITGSARGIGKAIALRYAQLGADIVVNYSGDEANANKTLAEITETGRDAIAIKADMTKVDEIERIFKETIEKFGKVDIVVANAGVELIDQPISEATEEQYDRLFAINSKGTFFTLQKAAKYVSDNGRIIYIGSSTTCNPFPSVGLYGSSKMATRYTVAVLAQEIGNRGVTVNTILPTTIADAGVFTDMGDDHPYHKLMETFRPIGGRIGQPSDVADAAEYFASDIAGWVSGQHLLVSGGAVQ
ncbi:short-chain dehydrogenase [Mycolicibacterium setense]|nr:short-chain dehydrogenase [Mycolicibacterium setense]